MEYRIIKYFSTLKTQYLTKHPVFSEERYRSAADHHKLSGAGTIVNRHRELCRSRQIAVVYGERDPFVPAEMFHG